MSRILALDWGSKRVGVAISDGLRMFASPFDTFDAKPRQELLRKIEKVIQAEEVELVIVGVPFNMDGTEGDSAKQARQLVEDVEKLGIVVETVDERLSSFQAEMKLREAGRKPSRDKGRIDRAAAAIFLQEYLDSLGNKIL